MTIPQTRENKIMIIHLNLYQILKMTDDHSYCNDPDHSLRNLKKKFNVLLVEQNEMKGVHLGWGLDLGRAERAWRFNEIQEG